MEKEVILIIMLLSLTACTQQPLTPKDASPSKAEVGYIGCSNTMQIVEAYLSVDGEQLWNFDEDKIHQYDGGAVNNWARPDERGYNEFWATFDKYLENNPNTQTVWWQLCIRKEDSTSYEDAFSILEKIREKIPKVTVYVSSLPTYTEDVCEITGIEGIKMAEAIVKELDEKNEDVLSGPQLGPMTPELTSEDGCHLSLEALPVLGEQMIQFFDNLLIPKQDSQESPPKLEETNKELTIEETHWNWVFEKAFEPVDCPSARKPNTLPDGYYKGPMIDTHIHLLSLPDGEPGHPQEYYGENNLGAGRSIEEWICIMDVEGTKQVFGFFPVWEPIIPESVAIVKQTLEKYPGRFIPFIMPPDDDGSKDGYPTVDAETMAEMLSIEPWLFKGYGEIGLYERKGGALSLPPDSKRLTEIYPVIRKNKLIVYFHLGEGQKNALEKAAKANPDITFIFHGDQLIDCAECDKTPDRVAEILENNPNVYYGVDELYGNVFLLNDEYTKEEFIAHFNNYEPLLKTDLANWEEFIENHPDQVIWGTDRGVSAKWDLDPKVALTLNDYTRAFIGRLDPAVQEKFAYKNAENLIRDK